MAEIIAIGKGSHRQSRQEIDEGEVLLVGRAPRHGWAVPWDRLISREHAELRLVDGQLEVRQLETARNPVFYEGQPDSHFSAESDSTFRIGDTTFHFRAECARRPGDSIISEYLVGDDPTSSAFANPIGCLQTLCKMPEIIAETGSDEDFAEKAVELLLESLRGSLAAAVMQFEGDSDDDATPHLIRWSSRRDQVTRFRPSRRLIKRALEHGQSVVHLWAEDDDGKADSNFTMNDDLDWAFCTPIAVDNRQRWCLYVSGKRRFGGLREVKSPQDLVGELRLAELIAKFIGAVRRVRSLEHQQTEMRQFFSPAVIETLTGSGESDALAPRLGPVSVLFCDVRGFSSKVEEASDDLEGLLGQVGEVLTAMTRSILKFEGVIADFQGDATLGFWGWPGRTPETALLACRAALSIASIFAKAEADPSSPLHGFRVGIGVTYGEAIAGRIGSHEQIKVGAFGPVVNLASRLQDLTKQLGAPILVDAGVVKEVGSTLDADFADFRRLARLRPPGMNSPTEVYALTAASSPTRLNDDQHQTYQAAVDAVIAGDWPAASGLLRAMPEFDGPSCFLLSLLTGAGNQAPADWDGALSMAGKGELRLRSSGFER